eukprot:TRINITY_DN16086_c0_g1_i1.p1 TRINITY_DN16086_c0_g1~~TRINITY_DN16086_c0_g1_i1.p1  ORF type:complete len:2427 (+),score=603.08 TRINITY_DN16086_c0_g1_i1:55-7335(+)
MAQNKLKNGSIVKSLLGDMKVRDRDLTQIEKKLGDRDRVISRRQEELRSVLEVLKGSGDLKAAVEADGVLDEKLVELCEGKKRAANLEVLLESKTSTVVTKQMHLHEWETRLDSLGSEHSSLKTLLIEREESVRAREECLRKRIASVDQHELALTQREARLRERTAASEVREASCSQKESTLANREQVLTEESSTVEALKRKTTATKNEVERLSAEIKMRQASLAQAEDALNRKRIAHTAREQQNLSQEAINTAITKELAILKTDAEERERALREAEANVRRKDVSLAGAELKAEVVTKQKMTNDAAEAALKTREEHVSKMDRELKCREISVRDYEEMHNTRMRELHERLEDAKEKQNLLDQQLEDLNNEKQVTELSFQSIDVANATTEQQRDGLKQYEEELEKRKDDLEAKEQRLAELEKKNQDTLDRATRLEEATTSKDRHTRERERLCDDRERKLNQRECTVTKKLAEAESVLANVNASSSTSERGLFPHYDAEEARLKKRRELLSARESEVVERQKRNTDREWNLKQREGRLLKFFEDKVDMINIMLGDARNKQYRMDADYYQQGKRLIEKKEAFKKRLADCEARERHLQQREKNTTRGRSVLEAELTLLKEESLAKTTRLTKLEEESAATKLGVKELHSQQRLLRIEREEVGKLKDECSKEKKQLEYERSEWEVALANCNATLASKEEAVAQKEVELECKLEEVRETEHLLVNRKTTLDDFDRELQSKSRAIDEEAAVQAELIEEQQSVFKLKSKTLDEDEAELRLSKEEVATLEAQHGELHKRLKDITAKETNLKQQLMMLELDQADVADRKSRLIKDEAELQSREAEGSRRESAACFAASLEKRLEDEKQSLQQREAEYTLKEASIKQRKEILHSREVQLEHEQLLLHTQQQDTIHKTVILETRTESIQQQESTIQEKQKTFAAKEKELKAYSNRLDASSSDLSAREERLVADEKQNRAVLQAEEKALERKKQQLEEREKSQLELEMSLRERGQEVHEQEIKLNQENMISNSRREEVQHQENVMRTTKEGLDRQELLLNAKLEEITKKEEQMHSEQTALNALRKKFSSLKESTERELCEREDIASEKESQLKILDESLNTLKIQLGTLQDELRMKEKEFEKVTQYVEHTKVENQQERCALDEQMSLLRREQADIETFKTELEHRDHKVITLARELETAKYSLQAKEEAFRAYEEQHHLDAETVLSDQKEREACLQQRERDVTALEAKNQMLQETLSASETHISKMQATLTCSQAAFEKSLQEVAAKQQDVERKEQRMQESLAALDENEQRLIAVDKELKIARRVLEEAQASWKTTQVKLDSEHSARAQAMATMEDDLRVKLANVVKHEAELSSSNEVASKQQAKLESLIQTHETQRSELQQKELELAQLTMDLQMRERTVADEVRQKVKEQTDSLNARSSRLDAMEASLQQKDANLARTTSILETREAHHSADTEAFKMQQATLLTMQKELNDRGEELARREVALRGAEQKLIAVTKREEELRDTETHVTNIKHEIEKRAASIKQQQQDTDKAHREVMNQKEVLQSRTAQISKHRTELDEQQRAFKTNHDAFIREQKKMQHLEESLKERDAALTLSHEKLVRMQAELTAKEGSVRDALVQHEKKSREMETQKAACNEAHRVLNEKTELLTRESAAFRAEKEAASYDLHTLTALKLEIETRQEQLSDTESKAITVRAKEEELARHEKELSGALDTAKVEQQRVSELKYEYELRLKNVEQRDVELREKEHGIEAALQKAREKEAAADAKSVAASKLESRSMEQELELNEKESNLGALTSTLREEQDANVEAARRLRDEVRAFEEDVEKKMLLVEEKIQRADNDALKAEVLERKAQQMLLDAQAAESEAAEAALDLERRKNYLQQQNKEESERVHKLEVGLLQYEQTLHVREEQIRKEEEAQKRRESDARQTLAAKESTVRVLETDVRRGREETAKRNKQQNSRDHELEEKERLLNSKEEALEEREQEVTNRWKTLMREMETHGKKERDTTVSLKREERRLTALKDNLQRKEGQLLGSRHSLRRTLGSVDSVVSSPSTVPARLHSPRSFPPTSVSPSPDCDFPEIRKAYSASSSPSLREPSSGEMNIVLLTRCWGRWVAAMHVGRLGDMFFRHKQDMKLRSAFCKWSLRSLQVVNKKDASVRRSQIRHAQREIERLGEKVLESSVEKRGLLHGNRKATAKLQKLCDALHKGSVRYLLARWMLRWLSKVTMVGLVEYSKMEGRLEALELMQTPDKVHTGHHAFAKLGMDVADRLHRCSLCTSRVMVTSVPSGPASEAGIIAGDMIVAVGSERVTCISDLRSAIMTYPPGAPCAIQLCRLVKLHWVKVYSYQNKASVVPAGTPSPLPLSASSSPPARDYAISVTPMSAMSGRSASALSINPKPPPPVDQVYDLSQKIAIPPDRH